MVERPLFHSLAEYRSQIGTYRLLPFRFARIPQVPGRVLVTSEVGEYEFLSEAEFQAFASGMLDPTSATYDDLQAKHFLVEGDPSTVVRLLAAKYRTKKSFLRYGPSLHIFVVSLRCDHSCHYCQVSRRSLDRSRFDMSGEIALAAVDRLFESPAPHLTVEFQGGEPLLAFDRIRQITEAIIERNRTEHRAITFTMTSTLHFLTDEMLAFFQQHGFHFGRRLMRAVHRPTRPIAEALQAIALVAR